MMRGKSVTIFGIFLLTAIARPVTPAPQVAAPANACKTASQGTCVCDLADGKGTIDLTPLVKASANKPFHTTATQFEYDYAFCGVVKEDPTLKNCYNKVTACEYALDGSYSGDLGRPNTARFELRTYRTHTNDVALVADSTNEGDQNFRRSVAFLNCDKNKPNVDYQAFGYSNDKDPDGFLLYYMEFTGSAFCPGSGGGGSGGGDSSLSGGSVLLIIFFSLAFTYFVGGFLVMTFYFKKEGMERIPNVSFWMDLPHLAKEGVLFSWNKGKQLCGRQ